MATPFAAQVGVQIDIPFDVSDVNGNLMAGQAAGVIKSLQLGTGPAAEPVSVVETGGGYYRASFTPTLGGTPPTNYYLRLKEGPGTAQRVLPFTIQAFDALINPMGPGAQLTTVDRVREALGLQPNQVGDNGYLANEILRCSDLMRRVCGRNFTQIAVVDELHDGLGREAIMVDDYPVVSVQSLNDDPSYEWGSGTEIAASAYYFRPNQDEATWIRLKGGRRFSSCPDAVRVSLTVGFASVPFLYENACIKLVVAAYHRRLLEGLTSRSIGDGSVQTAGPYYEMVEELCAPLKRVGLRS